VGWTLLERCAASLLPSVLRLSSALQSRLRAVGWISSDVVLSVLLPALSVLPSLSVLSVPLPVCAWGARIYRGARERDARHHA
jgi:hypothetical protein